MGFLDIFRKKKIFAVAFLCCNCKGSLFYAHVFFTSSIALFTTLSFAVFPSSVRFSNSVGCAEWSQILLLTFSSDALFYALWFLGLLFHCLALIFVSSSSMCLLQICPCQAIFLQWLVLSYWIWTMSFVVHSLIFRLSTVVLGSLLICVSL